MTIADFERLERDWRKIAETQTDPEAKRRATETADRLVTARKALEAAQPKEPTDQILN